MSLYKRDCTTFKVQRLIDVCYHIWNLARVFSLDSRENHWKNNPESLAESWLVADAALSWAYAWLLPHSSCAGSWCRPLSCSPSRTTEAWKPLLLLRWVLWLPWQEQCQRRHWRDHFPALTCAPSPWSTSSTRCATLSSWCAQSTTSLWSWASLLLWSPSSTWSCLRRSQMRIFGLARLSWIEQEPHQKSMLKCWNLMKSYMLCDRWMWCYITWLVLLDPVWCSGRMRNKSWDCLFDTETFVQSFGGVWEDYSVLICAAFWQLTLEGQRLFLQTVACLEAFKGNQSCLGIHVTYL